MKAYRRISPSSSFSSLDLHARLCFFSVGQKCDFSNPKTTNSLTGTKTKLSLGSLNRNQDLLHRKSVHRNCDNDHCAAHPVAFWGSCIFTSTHHRKIIFGYLETIYCQNLIGSKFFACVSICRKQCRWRSHHCRSLFIRLPDVLFAFFFLVSEVSSAVVVYNFHPGENDLEAFHQTFTGSSGLQGRWWVLITKLFCLGTLLSGGGKLQIGVGVRSEKPL